MGLTGGLLDTMSATDLGSHLGTLSVTPVCKAGWRWGWESSLISCPASVSPHSAKSHLFHQTNQSPNKLGTDQIEIKVTASYVILTPSLSQKILSCIKNELEVFARRKTKILKMGLGCKIKILHNRGRG